MTQDTPPTTECSRCHRKSEIVPLNIVCPFCVAADATKAERERIAAWAKDRIDPMEPKYEESMYDLIAHLQSDK